MSQHGDIGLQIAAQSLHFAKDGPLETRLVSAMKAARTCNERDVWWMTGSKIDDDMRFRTALAAVLLSANDDEREQIRRSLEPLKALSAAQNGIPVDFAAVFASVGENAIPLMKLWHDSAQIADEPPTIADKTDAI